MLAIKEMRVADASEKGDSKLAEAKSMTKEKDKNEFLLLLFSKFDYKTTFTIHFNEETKRTNKIDTLTNKLKRQQH